MMKNLAEFCFSHAGTVAIFQRLGDVWMAWMPAVYDGLLRFLC